MIPTSEKKIKSSNISMLLKAIEINTKKKKIKKLKMLPLKKEKGWSRGWELIFSHNKSWEVFDSLNYTQE